MGRRKKEKTKQNKEARKNQVFAKLRNYPISPRKMRLVADMIRGMNVSKAIDVLRYCPKHASLPMRKLLESAISNWEQKNEDNKTLEDNLFVKKIYVDSARMLKRIQPAPQGRAYKIRKRSCHTTIYIDEKINEMETNNKTVEKKIITENK